MLTLFINDTKVTISRFIEPDKLRVHHLYLIYDSKNTLLYAANLLEKNNSTGQIYIYAANEDQAWKDLYSLFEPVEAAGGIVTNSQDEILWIKRNRRWDLPKGKSESGETTEITALREVKEETGLTKLQITGQAGITYHSYIKNDSRLMKKTTWFDMKYCGSEPFRPATDEGIDEIRWFPKGSMALPFSETFNSIRELINSRNLSIV